MDIVQKNWREERDTFKVLWLNWAIWILRNWSVYGRKWCHFEVNVFFPSDYELVLKLIRCHSILCTSNHLTHNVNSRGIREMQYASVKKMPSKALFEYQTAHLDFLNPKEKEICSFPPGIEADQWWGKTIFMWK